MHEGGYDAASFHGQVQAQDSRAVGNEQSPSGRDSNGVEDPPSDAASVAAQAAGEQHPAGKLGGEVASLDDGVAGRSGVQNRTV